MPMTPEQCEQLAQILDPSARAAPRDATYDGPERRKAPRSEARGRR